MNKLSVIITTYNEGKVLRECVESLLKNTTVPMEIIIVIDEPEEMRWSTKESLSGLKNVRIVMGPERLGVGKCRNIGVEHATGDVLCFCDAHIFPTKGSLDILYRDALVKDGIIIPSFTNYNYRNPRPKKVGELPINYGGGMTFTVRKWWFYLYVERYDKRRFAPRRGGHAVGMSMRRDIFQRLGGWVNTPGFWCSNDAAMSIKAYYLGIPFLMEPGAHFFHLLKSVRSHGTPGSHQILNRFYIAKVLFSDEAYRDYWFPHLSERFPWKPEYARVLSSEVALREHEEFRSQIVRTDEEFLEEYVYPRLKGAKDECKDRGAAAAVRL